jgi:hypothetical protein
MTDFIYQEYIDNLNLCDEIIQSHKVYPNKSSGYVNKYGENVLDTDIKDSIETKLNFFPYTFNSYVNSLQKVLNSYMEKYPNCKNTGFNIQEAINVQHYKPGGGFKTWHCERSTFMSPSNSRHLVFMTYLNDVTDGGETEFFHQKLLVQPRKGLTLIWPTDWTHMHRGVVSPTQDKYIVTGWYSFKE